MKAGADVLGMPIEADDGRRIGTVTDLVFDDQCSRVLGLVMRTGYVFRTRHVVGFSEVQDINPRAVVVSDVNRRRPNPDEIAALGADSRSMQGKAVVTRQDGRYVGSVRDILFDETNGRVLALEVAYPGRDARAGLRTAIPTHLAYVIPDGVVLSDVARPHQYDHAS